MLVIFQDSIAMSSVTVLSVCYIIYIHCSHNNYYYDPAHMQYNI